jgi:hypothetical protein
MPYIVRLRKTDGTIVDLPDVYPGNAPCDEMRIGIPFQGGMIEGKVERSLAQREVNASSQTALSVPVVVVTMLRWIDRK